MPLVSFEGITRTEARAVHMIYVEAKHHDEACVRPGCVSDHLHITPSALSQILKTVEDKGLVERVRAKSGAGDSRAVSLVLTPEGFALAREIDVRVMEQTRALVSYVGEENFRGAMRTAELVIEFYDKALAGEIDLPGLDEPVVAPQRPSASASAASSVHPSAQGGERPCA